MVHPTINELESLDEKMEDSYSCLLVDYCAPLAKETSSEALPQVLVVDDEAMNVEVIVSMLREIGFESDSCLGAIFALPIVMDRIKKV